ncbi:unnamed protein product [Tetraodon nigroviridis]|uniref:(spotted green pufferfish) hypothetical protein n=1 Tax=Tetraodon nigroviridis TaxID=99883 RepID=Q4SNA8_TETNG|nr:unnamed protein product [Tetraodon nigroviridis]
MFYYPVVLKRHTGCFSTIWLVATKAIRIPRRDFLKVDVKNTCNHIMNYVLEQVPPPRPGLPRPRFSLYLSSQLQYGLVLVFHRQCVILLEDLQSIVSQLVKQKTSKKIDMEDPGRSNRFSGHHHPEGRAARLHPSSQRFQPTAGSSVDAGLMPLEDTGLSAPPAEQRTPVSIPMPPPPPSEAKRRETPAPQVPRDVAEPELFEISDPGSLPLEASDQREVSREISPMYTPEPERSSVARSVSALQDIPEVQDEFLERAAAEASGTVSSIFQRLLGEFTGHASINTRLLIPLFSLFHTEYLSSSKLSAQQEVPYGDILILPGPSYEEELQLV